jgi:hypothetical protein
MAGRGGDQAAQDRELALFIMGWLGLVLMIIIVGFTADALANTTPAVEAGQTPSVGMPVPTPGGALPLSPDMEMY